MSFVSNFVWRTVVLYTRLKPNGKFRMGLKGIEHLDYITLFTQLSGNLHLFVLNSEQSSGKKKINWKCDSQELFERDLDVYFLLHYSRKRFFTETV